MNKRLWILLLSGLAAAAAQGISVDEESLFGDTSQVVEAPSAAPAPSRPDGKSVGISGTVLAQIQGGVTRSYFAGPDPRHTSMGALALGDAALDVRLQRGFKAYADLEWSYRPDGAAFSGSDTGASFRLPEIFLDANAAHRVYFRAGKQVLQWGRGFFFNPTDLINVERKSFFRRIGSREGVYGIKAHAPFGTAANVYGFLDAHDVGRPDSLTGAGKVEFLAGRTEMAFMAWGGGHRDPVTGADFSSRFLGWDVTGELALHTSLRTRRLYIQDGLPRIVETEREWVPRAALGLGRSFRVAGVPDRLLTNAEYYYNHAGDARERLPVPPPGALPGGLSRGAALALLAQAGFYEPNSYSRHYAAIFAVFNRFLRSDLTLTFNAIGNLDQRCALLSGGVAYRDINDFSLTLLVNGFAGPDDTEYTFAGQALQAQIIAEVVF